MYTQIPEYLLYASAITPSVILIVGMLNGRDIDDLSEVGVSFLGLFVASSFVAAVMVAFGEAAAADFVVNWAGLTLIAILSAINAASVAMFTRQFRADFENADETLLDLRSDDVGDSTSTRSLSSCCTSLNFLDSGPKEAIVTANNSTTFIGLLFPVTVNFYTVRIETDADDKTLQAAAQISARVRAWYQYFAPVVNPFSLVPGVGTLSQVVPAETQMAMAMAEGSVGCLKDGEICAIEGVGGEQSREVNDCVVAVKITPISDKTVASRIKLAADVLVSFKGQIGLEAINFSASGGLKTSEGSTNAEGKGSLSGTLLLPRPDKNVQTVKRTVTFICQKTELL